MQAPGKLQQDKTLFSMVGSHSPYSSIYGIYRMYHADMGKSRRPYVQRMTRLRLARITPATAQQKKHVAATFCYSTPTPWRKQKLLISTIINTSVTTQRDTIDRHVFIEIMRQIHTLQQKKQPDQQSKTKIDKPFFNQLRPDVPASVSRHRRRLRSICTVNITTITVIFRWSIDGLPQRVERSHLF